MMGTIIRDGKTVQVAVDVTTGQIHEVGSDSYIAWQTAIQPELAAAGITLDQYNGGGVGATLLNASSAYSAAFAEHNTTGGGQEWATSVGGMLGFKGVAPTGTNEATVIAANPTTTAPQPTAGGINWAGIAILLGGGYLIYRMAT